MLSTNFNSYWEQCVDIPFNKGSDVCHSFSFCVLILGYIYCNCNNVHAF